MRGEKGKCCKYGKVARSKTEAGVELVIIPPWVMFEFPNRLWTDLSSGAHLLRNRQVNNVTRVSVHRGSLVHDTCSHKIPLRFIPFLSGSVIDWRYPAVSSLCIN